MTSPLVEFAHNNAVTRSTGKSPFEIVDGYSPRTPTDLITLPPNARVSQPTSTFALHIHDLHVEIRHKIAMSNDNYKLSVDVHRKDTFFEVGDFVIDHVRPERLPKNSYKKLHARAMGPYQIFRKLRFNAYELDLPDKLGISLIFNVEDLTLHQGTLEPPSLPFGGFYRYPSL